MKNYSSKAFQLKMYLKTSLWLTKARWNLILQATVWRETLEGANFGEFGEKSSNRQFFNNQCFPYIKRL